MVIVRGESVELPRREARELAARTNPTWPHVWARLECTFQEFLNAFPCNHVQAVPGDRVGALATVCEIAGIQPVVLGPAAAERPRPIWELVD